MSNVPWFFSQNNQQCGPVTEEELRRLFATAQLAPDSLVWAAHLPNWTPASALPNLTSATEAQMATPVPSPAGQPSEVHTAGSAHPRDSGPLSYQERVERRAAAAGRSQASPADGEPSPGGYTQPAAGPGGAAAGGYTPSAAAPSGGYTQGPATASSGGYTQQSVAENAPSGGYTQPAQAESNQQPSSRRVYGVTEPASPSLASSADEDYRRSWMEQQNRQQPRGSGALAQPQLSYPVLPDEAIFFPVAIKKFVIMSIATCGLYCTYWIYKNWKYYAAAKETPIRPVFRSWLFGIFYVHALIKEMRAAGEGLTLSRQVSGSAATWWIVLVLLARKIELFGILSMIPLLSVQRYLIELNVHAGRQQYINDKFKPSTWVAFGFGIVMWILIVIGYFIPDK